MKLLIFSVFLVASALALWTSSLENDLVTRLSEFAENGGNLASKKAAEIIVDVVAKYDSSETGFSAKELKELSRFLFDYLSGLIGIYKRNGDVVQKAMAVAQFNAEMARKLLKTFRDYTANMFATLVVIGNAVGKVIASRGLYAKLDAPAQLTSKLTNELAANLVDLIRNGGALVSKEAAELIVETIAKHDSWETGLSMEQLGQLTSFMRDFVAGVNEIHKHGKTVAVIDSTVRKYVSDKFIHLRQLFDDQVGDNAFYTLGDIAMAVGRVINWERTVSAGMNGMQ